jgi:Caspase domain
MALLTPWRGELRRSTNPSKHCYLEVSWNPYQASHSVAGHRPAGRNGTAGSSISNLQMIDLVQEINRELKASQVVWILDTCYSGDALTDPTKAPDYAVSRGSLRVGNPDPPQDPQTSPSFSAAFENLKVGHGRAVITASRANESSWESTKLQNGYFTHYLLEVLREHHGADSLDHVFAQVQTRVSSRVKAELNASQNPSFEFSEHADSIVLGGAEIN